MSVFDFTLPVIEMQHPSTGRKVTVLSMIHVGTEEFYNSCKEILSKHEGVILFEGVGNLTEQERQSLTDSQRLINQAMDKLFEFYETFATVMGWTTQSRQIPPQRDIWVHADITRMGLLKAWESEYLPPFPLMNSEMYSKVLEDSKSLEVMQDLIKGFLWHSGFLSSPFPRRLGRILLDQRNDVALSVFDDLPSDADALFLYGAKHGKGIIDGLKKRGYREQSRQTQHLFTVSKGAAFAVILLTPLIKTVSVISKLKGWSMSRRIRQEGYVAVFGMPESE